MSVSDQLFATKRDRQAQEIASTKKPLKGAYDRATDAVLELEAGINTEVKPWVAAMRQREAEEPVTQEVSGWVSKVDQLSHEFPKQVRDGMRKYDTLSWHDLAGIGRDGKPGVVENKRSDWQAETGQALNSHDGALGLLRRLMGQCKRSLDDAPSRSD